MTAVMSGPSSQGSLVTCAVRLNCQWLTRIVRVGERRGWDALINVILIDEGMAGRVSSLKKKIRQGDAEKRHEEGEKGGIRENETIADAPKIRECRDGELGSKRNGGERERERERVTERETERERE